MSRSFRLSLSRFWRRRTFAASLQRVGIILALLGITLYASVWAISVQMPGKSHSGALPLTTNAEEALAAELRRDVAALASDIGERSAQLNDSLARAADYVAAELRATGYEVERQTFGAGHVPCDNLIAERRGNERPDEIIVIGAHYDSVFHCAGANDNASGVAGLLALARRFADQEPARTIRFVAFANEEPPWFQTDLMGSLVYARSCRARGDNIIGMISLETIGYYSDEPGSQRYPPPFNLYYPSTGDFIAFVGNLASRSWVREVVGVFRRHAKFPSQGAAIPLVPQAGWSDHWSFWQAGYPALMVTDTAPFRYEHYHTPEDTPDKLDYDRMSRVVAGLERAIAELAEAK